MPPAPAASSTITTAAAVTALPDKLASGASCSRSIWNGVCSNKNPAKDGSASHGVFYESRMMHLDDQSRPIRPGSRWHMVDYHDRCLQTAVTC